MRKSFVYDRYRLDLRYIGYAGHIPVAVLDADGDYVKAQDALDREAVLKAQIATLETQLKDARRGVRVDVNVSGFPHASSILPPKTKGVI